MPTVLEKTFKDACETVKTSTKDISNQAKLNFYSLFKQAKDGNVQGDRPGVFSQVARAKWDSWNALKGITKEQAMQKYIDYVNKEL